jgi:predicted amidohydrolase
MPLISRRKFTQCVGTGLTLGGREGLERVASAAPTSIRVAAVQMTAALANVDANLLQAERLTRLAFERGARWVILPEFFTSAIAFHPQMANATRAINGPPAELLRKLAREGNAVVGGSFLAWRDGNAYNSFVLALPDGSVRRHDKDYPSYWEACYYIGGRDNGVLSTPDGDVGAALCYEFIRTRTAARLKGRIGMVVGGSCWWGIEDTAPPDDPMRKWLLDFLKAAPGQLARLLGVPVVHASHAGRFKGISWPGSPTPFPSSYLGETQIVNGRGEVLARMSQQDGEGVITADITLGEVPGERVPIPERFWIPDNMPAEEHRLWEVQLKSGHQYYVSTTRPALKKRFAAEAPKGKVRRNR